MCCPICSNACPEGAISLNNRDDLPRGLAVAAKGVLDTFETGVDSLQQLHKMEALGYNGSLTPERITV